MNFSSKRKTSNLILLISAFVIVSLILWNTNSFFKKFKEEERLKMEIWATAQLELVQSSVDQELGNLTLKVLGNNTSTPMILVNEEGSYKTHNIPEDKIGDSVYIRKKSPNSGTRTNLYRSYRKMNSWKPCIMATPRC